MWVKSLDSFGNYNFRREMEMINAMSWTAPYLDLSKITTRKGRNIHAFFGKSDEFDIHLIEMVRPNPHFDIIPLDHVNHGLIHALNASGVTPKSLMRRLYTAGSFSLAQNWRPFAKS